MYEEKKVKIPFRDIAIQILIVVLFVLIILWLFPTKNNVKKYVDEKENKSEINNNTNKNTNSNSQNSDSKNENKSENDISKKQYEYAKTSEGSYGNYGDWSEWSTNYIAPSETVEVQTEVRSGVVGYNTSIVQNGTDVNNNALVGTKTNNHVISGYNVKFIRTLETTEQKKNFDDYFYVLNSARYIYSCDGGTESSDIAGTPSMNNISYNDLIKISNNVPNIQPSSSCKNAKLFSTKYVYSLYQRIPIYTSKTENVYGSQEKPVYEQKVDNVYGNVTYYRYRTRSYQAGTESIKWSDSENDESLIAQGYHFTGNVK